MRRIAALVLVLTASTPAFAQLGDIFRKLDPNKIRKGANVARSMTREFTEDEEADIGRVVSARILKTYPLSKSARLQKYVTLTGNTVAAYSARPTLAWHFAVIESDVVNAFSAPAGYIFVTTGALHQMHSEAELAAVLGHEIAHATQKHILKEIKRSEIITSGLDLASSSTSSGSWLTDDLGKKIGEVATEKLFKTGLSRRDEDEADRIGVQLAEAAGYRGAAMIDFLHALEKLEGSSQTAVLTSTHPAPSQRIKTLTPLVRPKEGVLLAERFESWTTAK
jgi:predicted Zn-dependent protease